MTKYIIYNLLIHSETKQSTTISLPSRNSLYIKLQPSIVTYIGIVKTSYMVYE